MSDCGAEGSDPVMLVTPTATLDAHFQRVIELAWNPHQDGILISISYDSSVQVWDINTLTPLHNFQVSTLLLITRYCFFLRNTFVSVLIRSQQNSGTLRMILLCSTAFVINNLLYGSKLIDLSPNLFIKLGMST